MATQLSDPLRQSALIKGVFALIAGVVVAVIVLLCALRINEVVKVEEGELVADIPRVVYRAPYDVNVMRVLVREGDPVQPSDTLLVLENGEVTAQFVSAQEEYEAAQVNLELLLELMRNTQGRLANLQLQLENQRQLLGMSKVLYRDELEAIAIRLNAGTKQAEIAHSAFARDSLLYGKALLSKAEYERSYSAWLNNLREVQTLRSDYESRLKQFEKLDLDAAAGATTLRMDMLNVEAELLQLRQREAELEATVHRQQSELRAHREAFEKQYVVAQAPGRVHSLYNTKASADLVTKGDVLAEVVPTQGSVYARMQLRQDQVREVAVGQRVHLKLDAYYYYKYGVVGGEVRYVSSPDNQNNFYVIVDVEQPKNGLELKPGYRVKAEVIQGRVPLYEFILKRMFRNLEPGQPVPGPAPDQPDLPSAHEIQRAGAV